MKNYDVVNFNDRLKKTLEMDIPEVVKNSLSEILNVTELAKSVMDKADEIIDNKSDVVFEIDNVISDEFKIAKQQIDSDIILQYEKHLEIQRKWISGLFQLLRENEILPSSKDLLEAIRRAEK